MAVTLEVRNVSEQTQRALLARAAARGIPFNSYLLELLERDVATSTVADVLKQAAQRTERPSFDAVELTQAARDERERELAS